MLMPTAGDKLEIVPGPLDNPDAGYRSRFDHSDESASPGYYSVLLKDNNIKAELTSTRRAGFHRYTFPESNSSRIILDLGHQIGSSSKQQQSELRIINNNRIEGVKVVIWGKFFLLLSSVNHLLITEHLIMVPKLLNRAEVSGHTRTVKMELILEHLYISEPGKMNRYL
jgi:hypothetical protein